MTNSTRSLSALGVVALSLAALAMTNCDSSSSSGGGGTGSDASAFEAGSDASPSTTDGGTDGGDAGIHPSGGEAGTSCGVTRKFDIQYTDQPKLTASASVIYDPKLYKDGVLDTTCNPPMTFNHVIGYGTVTITGCVDACGAYVSSEAAQALVTYASNACGNFSTPAEAYGVPENAAVYNPPCEK